MKQIDNLSVNTLRMLSVDMINKANSGHPGIALGAAPILHTLFTRHLNIDPKKKDWFNRDRFILSAGHGSSLLYAMLHLSGFNLGIEDLKQFRQLNSLTPGHPEVFHTDGVEATSGPLGQGVAMGVGMAIAEAHLSAKYNKEDMKVVDHYTYVLCGDGCLQEGVALEALSLAGRLGLNKYIVLFDSNDIQLDGKTNMAYGDDIKKKIESMNFNYLKVVDGNDCDQIDKAIKKAKKSLKPTLIEIKTTIGHGLPNQGDCSCHGNPAGEEGRKVLAQNLGWNLEPFSVPEEVYEFYRKKVNKHKANKWNKLFKEYKAKYNDLAVELEHIIKDDFKLDEAKLPQYGLDTAKATRVISGEVLNSISEQIPSFIGGSADLVKSTNIKGLDGDFDITNRTGRNIRYGVREHAMGAIVNGMTLHKMHAFGSGFLVFSDYLKPAIRLAALMRIPSLFVFSHNSVLVGEDGPTHEPIEQLLMLRSIPNCVVFNPCDPNEVKYSFEVAYELKHNPSVITTTRGKVRTLENTSLEGVRKGGYILRKEEGKLDGIIVAAGSEVELAMDAACKLKELGKEVRVVSMPSTNLFDLQDQKYQDKVLPQGAKIMALELSHPASWYKYTKNVYGVNRFGLSAPAAKIQEELGFTVSKVVDYYLGL